MTPTALTRLYLARLKQYDPHLHCVVTLTESLALEQAADADREIAAGRYRGPLHGIPYGLKDLFAVRGTKTTWGMTPYKDRVIDVDATVYTRLTDAGAILVAKLSTGALAVIILVLSMVQVPSLQNIALLLWLFVIVLIVVDSISLGFRLKKQLNERFPDANKKGAVAYALMRTLQMRRLRLPKPQVKRGERP